MGDGTQKKSYLYISDAIDATMFLLDKIKGFYDVYNIGNEDWITVKEIAEIVTRTMNLKSQFIYTGGTKDGRGWPGDVKFMLLSIEKIKNWGGSRNILVEKPLN